MSLRPVPAFALVGLIAAAPAAIAPAAIAQAPREASAEAFVQTEAQGALRILNDRSLSLAAAQGRLPRLRRSRGRRAAKKH